MAAVTLLVLGVAVVVAIQSGRITGRAARPVPVNDLQPVIPIAHQATRLHTDFELEPKTLNELLSLSPDDLAKVGIARMNLLCASGLPGAEHLDAPGTSGIDRALAVLDGWLERIVFETDRHLYRVTDPRYAKHYRHSEAVFRAEMLTQVLAEDLGVKYDMTADGNFDFSNSTVAFIHGMIPKTGRSVADTPGGTCVSMPVLVAAMGRRLGYPIKLVTTDSHVFCRWEGANHPNPSFRGRFNMETTGGFAVFEDEYYKSWPRKITDHDVRANGYLISLTPAKEFALFLATRGHCGEDNGQYRFAARCYENAYGYDPRRPSYRAWFEDAAAMSDYRPTIPALARLLAQKKMAADARRAVFDPGVPMPRAGILPELPGATNHVLRAQPWRNQPITPGVPHTATPAIRAFNQPIQPEQPLGSQP